MMMMIKIKQGEEKIVIPMGIYVNGYIINAPMCTNHKSMVQLKRVVIKPNTSTTPTKENEDGDT